MTQCRGAAVQQHSAVLRRSCKTLAGKNARNQEHETWNPELSSLKLVEISFALGLLFPMATCFMVHIYQKNLHTQPATHSKRLTGRCRFKDIVRWMDRWSDLRWASGPKSDNSGIVNILALDGAGSPTTKRAQNLWDANVRAWCIWAKWANLYVWVYSWRTGNTR